MTTTQDKPGLTGTLNGLCYSFPTSGSIRLGRSVVRERKGGKPPVRIPVKEDEFILTTKVKEGESWVRHHLDETLRTDHGVEVGANGGAARKLRCIPVRIVFDRPELNMSEQFVAFSPEGSPLCVGDGRNARRMATDGTVTDEPCPGASRCAYGAQARCDAYMRLLVRVAGQGENEPPFILRTGSINAVTDNRATLQYWHAFFKGRLAGLKFNFVLDAKQSSKSYQSVFYFGRLEPAFGSVIEAAKELSEQRALEAQYGIDRVGAEDALMALRNNGPLGDEAEGDQFDDLLAGRFFEGDETERRELSVIQDAKSGVASAADAIRQLTQRLEMAPAALAGEVDDESE